MSSAATRGTAAAYLYCRSVAKREAKNFYYAFRVLPRHKSDAMCAVYAFMRKADDLADDESMSLDQRRAAMTQWAEAWRASRTRASDDPVFVALKDTQQRFGISDELLEQLVAGTTMDLQERLQGVVEVRVPDTAAGEQGTRTAQVYETFADLYRYCYLVASVVGLVCIRIFGYSDTRAEELAEHTGVAFQLTNILRDVVEDAGRGRIYLPMDDLARTGVEPAAVVLAGKNGVPSTNIMSLLRLEIDRAQGYYRASDQLIPLLDADSREAMRVLATIYHELLNKIAADPAAVFRSRVSVPAWRKLAILGGGMVRSVLVRGRG